VKNPEPTVIFDRERASSYDRQFAKLAPMRDALHFLMREILSELPIDARILCVGVGTGSELIYLAQNFPQWHFTAVEPAAPMLDICRQKAEELAIAPRCTFYEGYLDSLPASDAFDAATCLLVSHFIMQQDERSNFFGQIAARLKPKGYLISADLAADTSTSEYQSLLEFWLQMFKYAEIPIEKVENMRASLGRDVALLPPNLVKDISEVPTDKSGASSFIGKCSNRSYLPSQSYFASRGFTIRMILTLTVPRDTDLADSPLPEEVYFCSYNISWIYNNCLPVEAFIPRCSCSLPSQVSYYYIPLFSAMRVSQRLLTVYRKMLTKFIPSVNRGTSFRR